ncbi:hypothetical protein ACFFTN_01120 [Aminobacter aganoensis]|uniref:Uncharacterized protein n=1 Tax=Aminobacter aganoensis TaxID=83264 RepID=A0A7X0F5W8_9HYPH|nr:hypothetical protein [Aminobacter aganoensis]MBB6353543.1 hypothetical protein [Aminobacter aganoensis]
MADIANRLREGVRWSGAHPIAGDIDDADTVMTEAADALDAKDKRIAELEAALLMHPMAERIADLPDFMVALSDWGCVDPGEQADTITKFLNSTVGLREYLEDQTQAGGRDGN